MRLSILTAVALSALPLILEGCSLLHSDKEYISSFGDSLWEEFQSWGNIAFTIIESSTNSPLKGNHRIYIESGYHDSHRKRFWLWETDFHVDTLHIEFIGYDGGANVTRKQLVSSVDVIEGSGETSGRVTVDIRELENGCFKLYPTYSFRAELDTFHDFNPGPATFVDSMWISFPGCESNQQDGLDATQFVGSEPYPVTEDGVRNLITTEAWLSHHLDFGKVYIPDDVDSVRITFNIKIVDHFADSVVAMKSVDRLLERSRSVVLVD